MCKHNCYGDAVFSDVGGPAGSGGPEKALASCPGSPAGPRRTWPGAARRLPGSRSGAWPGPPFPPVTQSRAPEYHLLLRNITQASAG